MAHVFHAGAPSELWSSPTVRQKKSILLSGERKRDSNASVLRLNRTKNLEPPSQGSRNDSKALIRGELKQRFLGIDGFYSWDSSLYAIEDFEGRNELVFRDVAGSKCGINVPLRNIREIKFSGGGKCRFDIVINNGRQVHSFLAPNTKICKQWVCCLQENGKSSSNQTQWGLDNQDHGEYPDINSTWGQEELHLATLKSAIEGTSTFANSTVSDLAKVNFIPKKEEPKTKKKECTKNQKQATLGGLTRETVSSLMKSVAVSKQNSSKSLIHSYDAQNRLSTRKNNGRAMSMNAKRFSHGQDEKKPARDVACLSDCTNQRLCGKSINSAKSQMTGHGLPWASFSMHGSENMQHLKTRKSSFDKVHKKSGESFPSKSRGRHAREQHALQEKGSNVIIKRERSNPNKDSDRHLRMEEQIIALSREVAALKREVRAVRKQRDAFEMLLSHLSRQHLKIKKSTQM